MRCDLHVHTVHSGMCGQPLAKRFCRESYNQPEAAYLRLKSLGMNLVTVTDHDSIGAADELARHPDFFLSEEVTVTMPGGTEAHVSVYGLDQRQHFQIQRLSDDVPRLVAYLREQRLAFGVNHVFSSLTGRRSYFDFDCFERYFPLLEIVNGAMIEFSNQASRQLAVQWGKGATAGSDAHSLRGLGTAFTEVPSAATKEEFLQGLRLGYGRARGTSGGYRKLTAEIATIILELMREKTWTRALAPIACLLPAVTLGNYLFETLFAKRWASRILEGTGRFPASPVVSGDSRMEVPA